MSSIPRDTKAPSAGQKHRNGAGQAQKQTLSSAKAYQYTPSSAYEYQQQKKREPVQRDENSRHGQAATALTSQAMTRFEQQPQNNLQALDDRITEYRKSSPSHVEQRKSPNDHQRQIVDSMKAWSDEWKRLERK